MADILEAIDRMNLQMSSRIKIDAGFSNIRRPQRLKPRHFAAFTARLKSGPSQNHSRDSSQAKTPTSRKGREKWGSR
jgi:hypothetical protein